MYSGENYFDGWLLGRLGKFTASKISCCMQPKGIGDGGMTYIRSRAFEALNGISSEKEVDTDAMRWGLLHEKDALKEFVKYKNIPIDEKGRVPIIVQKLVAEKGSQFGCTPDGIWVQEEFEKEDVTWLKVVPQEVKCYQLTKHLKCVACDTPQKIKAVDPDAYWQLLMQIFECDALVGYLIYYYPNIKYGGLRIIEFRKVDIVMNVKVGEKNDFKLMAERRLEIMRLFEEEKNVLMGIKN